jgi:hypothetical protein
VSSFLLLANRRGKSRQKLRLAIYLSGGCEGVSCTTMPSCTEENKCWTVWRGAGRKAGGKNVDLRHIYNTWKFFACPHYTTNVYNSNSDMMMMIVKYCDNHCARVRNSYCHFRLCTVFFSDFLSFLGLTCMNTPKWSEKLISQKVLSNPRIKSNPCGSVMQNNTPR